MIDPGYNLQKAVVALLNAANIGSQVYHTIPAKAALPWVLIGDDQILSDYSAGDFSECFVTVHVYDLKPKHKLIAAKVRLALDMLIDIEGFETEEAWFDGSNPVNEKDQPELGHLVLTFRYLVQPS